MKKILVVLMLLMPLLASAQSYFTVESNGIKHTYPLEGTTITITDSQDDSDVPTEEAIKKYIAGKWQAVHISGWADEISGFHKVDRDITEDEDEYAERILFNNDGTAISWYYSTEDKEWQAEPSCKYEILGNKLVTYIEDYKSVASILSIDSNTLVVEFETVEETEYRTKVTYKKISN